ncbi:hypothetical protein N7468_003978 [Penicillium chermesinum]|uniref:Uncharacterized protein n=1 Tax=Penicillium chermesinum TaxID=63820 RepID=A0A9W9P7G3_9EURO|nr:uncharacterized protein N7468_003978 [Penicillium chermesinum]KAJ5239359.1 hypothetical protein N7468_003978 [Penicillium chermesinum]
MSGRNVSYGRGGAGNIARQTSSPAPSDLVTPTIKQEIYTTGRGGSGNMVQNDPKHPEIARESQDVESPPLRAQQMPHHTGRGGAANFLAPDEEQKAEHAIQREEAELMRVRTQDRIKEIEQGRQDPQAQSSA